MPVAWQETRRLGRLVSEAYGLPFCLASITEIKQCSVVKPSHSALIACLWKTAPSDVFQTACKTILSSQIPHSCLTDTTSCSANPLPRFFRHTQEREFLVFWVPALRPTGTICRNCSVLKSMGACPNVKGYSATTSEILSFRFLLHNLNQCRYFI